MYKALLVDDDEAVLSTLRLLFQTRHFEVTSTGSARQATEILASNAVFDLVVTDMRMETNTAGFEVVRSAKRRPNAPVVVILSAFPIPANEWRKAGADALFAKGGGSFAMIRDIEQMLNSHVRARSAS